MQRRFAADIAVDEIQTPPAEPFHSAQRVSRTVAQVVEHDYIPATFKQLQRYVSANISRTTGHQNHDVLPEFSPSRQETS
ncbi:Unknown protein sequence [Pseudomonas syringae pv. maculicola]|nr:Unknown protein sequence [Pseudomonas syringae pv. maculicola]